MTLKPIIPEDIQAKAQEMVKGMTDANFTETHRRAVGMMICFAMAHERYRCVNITEQFDPEIAARLWSDQ